MYYIDGMYGAKTAKSVSNVYSTNATGISIKGRPCKLSATSDRPGVALMPYQEFSIEERITIQFGHLQGFSLRKITILIKRSPSTISRELRPNRESCGRYSGHAVQHHMRVRRRPCQHKRKLLRGIDRVDLAAHMLRDRLSPSQIAG